MLLAPAPEEWSMLDRPANMQLKGSTEAFETRDSFWFEKARALVALSAFCTHRKCKMIAEPNRSFYCNCHGSTFDLSGKVTIGPAKRDLAILPAVVDERGHLLVTVAVT
jgi:Rieske Fe-S protein